jgi:hypothetical protein
MAPRKSATPQPSTPKPSTTTASTTPSKPPSRPSSSSSVRSTQDAQQIVIGVWNNYVDKTPQRVKLLDAFMVFLMTVGLIQFVYCVVAGNYVRDSILYICIGCCADSQAALQRLPLGLLGMCWAVRAHSQLANADEHGE